MEQSICEICSHMTEVTSGTADPSSTLYSSNIYLMAALLGVALVYNLLVKPVDVKYHLREDE
jgi:hypothetical protein